MRKTYTQSNVKKIIYQLGYREKRLGLRKVLINTINMQNKRATFARKIIRTNINNLLYLDKTGFNLHTCISTGYTNKMKLLIFLYLPTEEEINHFWL